MLRSLNVALFLGQRSCLGMGVRGRSPPSPSARGRGGSTANTLTAALFATCSMGFNTLHEILMLYYRIGFM